MDSIQAYKFKHTYSAHSTHPPPPPAPRPPHTHSIVRDQGSSEEAPSQCDQKERERACEDCRPETQCCLYLSPAFSLTLSASQITQRGGAEGEKENENEGKGRRRRGREGEIRREGEMRREGGGDEEGEKEGAEERRGRVCP